MTKRKTTRKPDRTHLIVKYLSLGAIALLLLSLVGVAGYYFGYEAGREQMVAQLSKERAQTQKLLAELKSATVIKPEKSRKERLAELLKKHEDVVASHEYDKAPPEGPKRQVVKSSTLPKLAIIIDDVSFERDVENIKALELPVTMSFLPPSARHPDSAKLAANETTYMVHLPLEAMQFNAEEKSTLYVKDSQQRISDRISEIKKLFPRVKYVNNHTGSRFTASEIAMNRLMFALRKEKIMFIDSRTTAETQVPRVMKNYGLPYIARDVFLDHVADVGEIKQQIRRAIGIAKQSGSAIAIGHPRRDTLQALRESKALFKEVQLVTIDNYL